MTVSVQNVIEQMRWSNSTVYPDRQKIVNFLINKLQFFWLYVNKLPQ